MGIRFFAALLLLSSSPAFGGTPEVVLKNGQIVEQADVLSSAMTSEPRRKLRCKVLYADRLGDHVVDLEVEVGKGYNGIVNAALPEVIEGKVLRATFYYSFDTNVWDGYLMQFDMQESNYFRLLAGAGLVEKGDLAYYDPDTNQLVKMGCRF